MKNVLLVLISATIAAVCLWTMSCTSPTGVGQSIIPDTTITVTVLDTTGGFTVVSEDRDDWRVLLSKNVHYVLGGRQFDPWITPAFPNPAHDSVAILFQMGREGRPLFIIYNNRGELVRSLFQDSIDAGAERAVWHCDDASGNRVPPGYYRCVYSWDTAVCDGPLGTSCSQMIDLTVFGHGDIKVQ